ncbi:putative reverse transcriptase domain-containing protein [Tanacetum coccineum]
MVPRTVLTRPNAVVNTARPKAVLSAVKGNKGNAVKAISMLDYEEIDGGFVAFGGGQRQEFCNAAEAEASRVRKRLLQQWFSTKAAQASSLPCTYSEFLKCKPLDFKGTEGVVGLTRWFCSKMESVFSISIAQQLGQTTTPEVSQLAMSMGQRTLKKIMTDNNARGVKSRRIETEMWNLRGAERKRKYDDLPQNNQNQQQQNRRQTTQARPMLQAIVTESHTKGLSLYVPSVIAIMKQVPLSTGLTEKIVFLYHLRERNPNRDHAKMTVLLVQDTGLGELKHHLVVPRVLRDFPMHRSLINNNASLSNKFEGFYFIFKFGISSLLHHVVTAIADRMRGWMLFRPLAREVYVQFSRYTRVVPSYTPLEAFPRFLFEFVEYENLKDHYNDDKYLTNVIGILTEWGPLMEKTGNNAYVNSNVRNVVIHDLSDNRVHVTIWGKLASKFMIRLSNQK